MKPIDWKYYIEQGVEAKRRREQMLADGICRPEQDTTREKWALVYGSLGNHIDGPPSRIGAVDAGVYEEGQQCDTYEEKS